MPDRVVQKNLSSKANVSEQFPLWLRIVVGIGAVLLIAGALISLLHPILLVSPHDEINFRATWGWQSRVSHGSAVTSACHAERHVATDGLHANAGRVY